MATNRRRSLLDRPTGDVMILMVAVTLCLGVIAIGTTTLVFAFLNPQTDVTSAFRFVANILNTMIGLLAGYLAGRTEKASASKESDEPDRPPGG